MYAYMEPCNYDNITEWVCYPLTVDIDGVLRKWDVHIGFNKEILKKANMSLEKYLSDVYKRTCIDTQKDVDALKEYRALPLSQRKKVGNLSNAIKSVDMQIERCPIEKPFPLFVDEE